MMRILSITNESETIRAAANTLHNISCSPQGLDNIWKYDGIPALFKCLGLVFTALIYLYSDYIALREKKSPSEIHVSNKIIVNPR